MNRIGFYVVGAFVALLVAFSTLFIVDQRQFAVIYALGEIKEVVTEPGLKFKLPPPFQNVVFLDRRTQTLDSPETRPIFTAEKKSLVIDWLVKWRVTDARQFIRNNGVDMRNVESRLSPIVQAAFNEEVTKRTADRRGQVFRHRDCRRAHQARRFLREHHRFGLPPHGIRAQARRQ
jgi:membrane protease subunit HflC